ncbi:thiol-disulfide isomerase/thioredoxin [Mesoflavibacter sabulilitoris]|uniref:Redoxin n=1 Tax=Mesoflavibacter zeaxanthinifaciens subsp. sabulilitoris TaxID=1520893 RepID=A0A2T1N664_9FLAO|nr:redoxin domain-containing protein [Mesoflavibacter zeaxanthinifaciens]MBB3123342.1 thiol-disulfide isomerase/thioredoxin [Mesoflavibacter zeaxanthinifaciens subsp. sabulilitoris]PSG87024.1 redoxin [Mesoflavibacter zeaxanthinifaciens subsp. sabulilitoris]
MKSVFKKAVAILLLVLLAYLVYSVVIGIQEKNQIAKQLQTIPEFEFLTLEQQPFTKADLKPEKNTIFIYFNTECDFCQHEAQSISDNLESFKEVQFMFVSTEPINTIRQFSEQYNLNNKQNITFLYDNLNTFSSRFGAASIPFILIYDNEQKLIKKHKGQLNAKGILRALQYNE